jgi:hypothetical protein
MVFVAKFGWKLQVIDGRGNQKRLGVSEASNSQPGNYRAQGFPLETREISGEEAVGAARSICGLVSPALL